MKVADDLDQEEAEPNPESLSMSIVIISKLKEKVCKGQPKIYSKKSTEFSKIFLYAKPAFIKRK